LLHFDYGSNQNQPLNVVQEKAKMERSASQRQAAPPPGRSGPSAITRHEPVVDLFGDEPVSAPARPVTGPPMSKPPLKAEPAPPKATKPADSLLGLDFFGSAPTAPPARPSSTSATSSSATTSRPDLKQSILSLYASKPAAAPVPQQQQYQASAGQFGGMTSAQTQSPPPQQSAFGGMNDAFGSLSFGAPANQPPAKPSPFDGLAGMSSSKSTPAPSKATQAAYGGGGSFFDVQTSPPKVTAPAAQRGLSSNSGFGDFFSSTSPATSPPAAASSQGNDLFDLMGGGPAPSPVASKPPPAAYNNNNAAFNLSSAGPSLKPAAPAQTHTSSFANLSSNDVWGSASDAWGDSKPAASAVSPVPAASNNGWGASSGGFGAATKVTSPTVTGDDDFGGWSSAPHASVPAGGAPPPKSAFNSANDDLFSNVWE
jgi:stromal membrane-associated protein